MKTAYFDCFSGAGGDMIVASLVDAGADADELRKRLAALGLTGYRLSIEQVKKQGFAATRFDVQLEPSEDQPHRRLKDVLAIIERVASPLVGDEEPAPPTRGDATPSCADTPRGPKPHGSLVGDEEPAPPTRGDATPSCADTPRGPKPRGSLSDQARSKVTAIFQRLAEAEAAVHGTTVQEVHFHEVGAVDAILDIVGAVIGLELLGVQQVLCSALPVGSGTVRCAHGLLPVPAPATAQLLKGVPIAPSNEVGELLTPTAAAVLTTLAEGFGPPPAMCLEAVGYGAGTRDGAEKPNLLRIMVGEAEPAGEADQVAVLEANLDDVSPEVVGHCLERLLNEGALDAYTVPIQMKKSRSGVLLTVLCGVASVEVMQDIIFAETTTFGIRRHHAHRAKLSRRHEEVATPYGPVRIKVGRRGSVITASPEYEDCRAAALKHEVPLREVMDAARTVWANKQRRS